MYILKVFSFCTMAKIEKCDLTKKNRNHDYRVNNFMRNNLNGDNQF